MNIAIQKSDFDQKSKCKRLWLLCWWKLSGQHFTFASVDSIVNLWTGDFVHISDLNVERLHRVSNTILRHLYCLTSTYLAWSTYSLSRIENPTSLTTFSSPDSKSNRPGSNPTEQLQLTLLAVTDKRCLKGAPLLKFMQTRKARSANQKLIDTLSRVLWIFNSMRNNI